MSTTQHYTGPDGTQLAYLDEGEGPVVLLLHALTANAQANWVETGVVSALVGAGFRTLALDARGHGHSDAPVGDEAYHPDVLAADVTALVEQLAIQPAAIVGYSYGARTAAQLAAAGDVVPRALVLGGMAMSSLLPIPSGPETDAILAAMAAQAGQQADGEQADDLGGMRDRMAGWNTRPAAVASIYGELRYAGPIDLGAIGVPTLLLHSPAEPDDVVAHIPGARTVIVSGDHITAPLDPAFTEAILQFLKEAAS